MRRRAKKCDRDRNEFRFLFHLVRTKEVQFMYIQTEEGENSPSGSQKVSLIHIDITRSNKISLTRQ